MRGGLAGFEKRSLWLFLLMLVASFVLLLNWFFAELTVVGFAASLVYFVCGSFLVVRFLRLERDWVNLSIGAVFLLTLVVLANWFFTVFYKLGVRELFVSLCAVAVFVFLAQRFLGGQAPGKSFRRSDRRKTPGVHFGVRLLEGVFIALVGFTFVLLWESRTPVPTTVWDNMDPMVMPLLFLSTLILVLVMFSGERRTVKLLLILVQSVLAHMFFVLVFESGYGLDPWVALGWSRRILDESNYPRYVYFNIHSGFSFHYKVFKGLTAAFVPTLEVVVSRLFGVDVYWVNKSLVPLLWGIFFPLIMYRLAEFLTQDQKLAEFSALLTLATPSLILWGAVTTGNSVGFIFFSLTIVLLIDYLSSDKKIVWALISVVATFMTHAMTGIMAFAFFVFAFLFKRYQDVKSPRLRISYLFGSFVVSASILLIALYSGRLAYPALTGADFTLEPLLELSAFDAVMTVLIGAYADFLVKEALVQVMLSLLGFFGLIYVNTIGSRYVPNRRLRLFMLFIFVLIMLDYRIIKGFMVRVPFGKERLWVLRNILAVPFASILIFELLRIFSKWLAISMKTVKGHLKVLGKGFSSNLSKVVIILFVSGLISSSVFLGYPQTERPPSWAWPTSLEIEAARYIDSVANGPYVVLAYQRFKLAAYSIVGVANPEAYYFLPFSREGDNLYKEATRGSSEAMVEAAKINNASVGFFVTSKVRFADAENAIEILSARPDFKLIKVFEDDIYIFRYDLEFERYVSGVGPGVYIYNQQRYLNTSFVYDAVTYEIDYTLELSGADRYYLTEWPDFWSFERIQPTPETLSVDANIWINFTGDSDVTYKIIWEANLLYRYIGWKDDSFLSGWSLKRTRGFEEEPTMSMDGDVLTLTGDFKARVREFYWMWKQVNISTDLYPYLLIRWKSTGTCAIAWAYYSDGTDDALLDYSSYSAEWTTTIVRLSAGKTVQYIMVGLDDARYDVEGRHIAYFDFVMVANMTTPG